MERKLCWEPQYAFEKIFPLVTRWQLIHIPNISVESRLTMPDLFVPEAIKKVRNIRSVASYEIIWKTDHHIIQRVKEYMAVDKENDDDSADVLSELTSIEPQDAVRKCYPGLIEIFEEAKNAKTKKRRAKNKAQNGEATVKRQAEKRRQKKVDKVPLNIEGNSKIDEFTTKNPPITLEESFERMSITPKRSKKSESQKLNRGKNGKLKRGPQIDKVLEIENMQSKFNSTLDRMFNELSPDDFISDNDDQDMNMSDIIDNICSRRAFQFNNVGDACTPENINNICGNLVEDAKFIDNVDNVSMELTECQQNNAVYNQTVDEFDDINESYVPLNQRILTYKEKLEVQKQATETNDRCSLGFDDLMNDTDPDTQFAT